ncbi:MAG: hypothetical protein H8E13_10510 [Actinobacteria bacterium]|nr:hypothetical protein [Actinomycetota bacterium]
MKLKIFPLAIVLFIAFLFILASCSYGDNNTIEEKLQKVLGKGISKYGVRGVSAAVIFPDQKVWKGVSGISHDTVLIKPDIPSNQVHVFGDNFNNKYSFYSVFVSFG